MARALAAAALLIVTTSCVRTLPDQDRRIFSVAPGAKVSVDVLWKDFQAGVPDANRRYHGRAIVVSGMVTRVNTSPALTSVFFAVAADQGVTANLLDDQAAAIAKAATPGQRITLKCFCEGFDVNVILKSCVRP
jgi:putative nucleic acid binding protein